MARRNNKRVFAIYILSILFPLLAASCNLFQWMNPPLAGTDASSLVEQGNRYFNDKQFDKALTSYSNALILSPGSSEARVGYARSIFWLFLPDFMTLTVNEMAQTTNSDVIYDAILSVFNSPEGQQAILAHGSHSYYRSIIDVLDSPDGIVNGQGDQKVGYDTLEVNILLILAYASDLFLSVLDSNGDGIYGSTNGDLIFITNGQFGYNENIMSLESNINLLFNVNESNSVSEVLSNLRAGHDTSEDVLGILQFVDSKVGYADKIYAAMLRPRQYLEYLTPDLIGGDNVGEGYSNLYDSLLDAYTNSNSLSPYGDIFYYAKVVNSMVADAGGVLNDMHYMLVGDYAYTDLIANFVPSAWDTHNGGLKATVSSFGDLTNLLTTTNMDTILSNLTNNFTMEDISNMMDYFIMLFGGAQ